MPQDLHAMLLPDSDPRVEEYLNDLIANRVLMTPRPGLSGGVCPAADGTSTAAIDLETELSDLMDKDDSNHPIGSATKEDKEDKDESSSSDMDMGCYSDWISDHRDSNRTERGEPVWVKLYRPWYQDARLAWPPARPPAQQVELYPGLLALNERDWGLIVYWDHGEHDRSCKKVFDTSQCFVNIIYFQSSGCAMRDIECKTLGASADEVHHP